MLMLDLPCSGRYAFSGAVIFDSFRIISDRIHQVKRDEKAWSPPEYMYSRMPPMTEGS